LPFSPCAIAGRHTALFTISSGPACQEASIEFRQCRQRLPGDSVPVTCTEAFRAA
jgi:hypothetical protein